MNFEQGSPMQNPANKAVLLLNALILIVTFVLALGTQSSQLDLLGASAAYAGDAGPRRHGPDSPAPIAYVRLLQSLEQFAPREKIDTLNPHEMRALYDALDHYAWKIGEGMRIILSQRLDGAQTRAEIEKLAMDARDGVHTTLSVVFRDAEFVSRVTAAIVGGAR